MESYQKVFSSCARQTTLRSVLEHVLEPSGGARPAAERTGSRFTHLRDPFRLTSFRTFSAVLSLHFALVLSKVLPLLPDRG